METLATIIALFFLLSIVGLAVSLAAPRLVNRLIRKQYTRKQLAGRFGGAMLACFIFFGFVDPEIADQELVLEQEQIQEQQEHSSIQEDQISAESEEDIAETDLAITSIDDEDFDSAAQPTSEPAPQTQTTAPVDQVEEIGVPEEDNNSYYRVVRVVDGDTIRVNVNGTEEIVRLIGIDTPELVDTRRPVECFAQEASQKANELLADRMVRLETDPTQDTRDVFGRLLAYAYRDDGLFFNQHMIETGYAFEYTYRTPYQFQQEFKTAEQNARTNNLGLWSPDTCAGDVSTGTVERGQGPEGAPVGNYYTSSHHSSRYYYPRECNAWHGLSMSNLRAFDTLEELLYSYNRTLSPQCN